MTGSSSILRAEYSSDRHGELIAALMAGSKAIDLVPKFKLTAKTIQKIARTAKKFETYSLALTDGQTTVPVATIQTSKGFEHACQFALMKYRDFFRGLELPTWRLVAGGESVLVCELMNERK